MPGCPGIALRTERDEPRERKSRMERLSPILPDVNTDTQELPNRLNERKLILLPKIT